MRSIFVALMMLCLAAVARAQPAAVPATGPAGGKLPHVQVDVKARQVRVECEALGVEMPLELFCVQAGGPEHETVLRTKAKPSHIHLALLMVGLEPGKPVHFDEAAQKWLPPQGPPLQISVEYEKDGQTIRQPAHRWMRNVRSKKEAPPMTWVFTGSRIMEDKYAADVTGYVVSIVNFDMAPIDVPRLASSDNETLDLERNPDLVPKSGTKVWMIVEPAARDPKAAPSTQPAAPGN